MFELLKSFEFNSLSIRQRSFAVPVEEYLEACLFVRRQSEAQDLLRVGGFGEQIHEIGKYVCR